MLLSAGVLETGSTLTRKKDEGAEVFFARVSHITLIDKGLTEFSLISLCTNLKVLALYDNAIEIWPVNFDCPSLEYLYLQGNALTCVGYSLNQLTKLKYLDLSSNCISIVSGMNGLKKLATLKLDHQEKKDGCEEGNKLVFDSESMAGLESLTIISAIGNGISTLEGIAHLPVIEQVNLSCNNIEEFEQSMVGALKSWKRIKTLQLMNNPVVKNVSKFRESVISIASKTLAELNGKEIREAERVFIAGMREIRRRGDKAGKSIRAHPSVLFPMHGDSKNKNKDSLVIPHLPPYATQYRDLILQYMQSNAVSPRSGDTDKPSFLQ